MNYTYDMENVTEVWTLDQELDDRPAEERIGEAMLRDHSKILTFGPFNAKDYEKAEKDLKNAGVTDLLTKNRGLVLMDVITTFTEKKLGLNFFSQEWAFMITRIFPTKIIQREYL